MGRADCNECIHRVVCKYQDDVMKALEEERRKPSRGFGGEGKPAALMKRDIWVECNYFNRGTTEELRICI